MITAADVGTLLFDVIGTVVDEGGTMRAEVAAELEAAGLAGPGRAEALAAAWEERAGEGRPAPSDSFGLSCPDLAALAAHLTGG